MLLGCDPDSRDVDNIVRLFLAQCVLSLQLFIMVRYSPMIYHAHQALHIPQPPLLDQELRYATVKSGKLNSSINRCFSRWYDHRMGSIDVRAVAVSCNN